MSADDTALTRYRLNWAALTPEGFEALCADLLLALGFANLQWHGKGGADRGRDLVADKAERLFGGKERILKVIVQCKHRTRVGPSHLADTLAWAEAHKPDIVTFMLSGSLTTATKDWIGGIERGKPFRIYELERCDLELQIALHPEVLSRHFASPGAFVATELEREAIIACGKCRSPRTGALAGAYFVVTSCEGCAHVAAMCYDCIEHLKKVEAADRVHCASCSSELRFGDGIVYFDVVGQKDAAKD